MLRVFIKINIILFYLDNIKMQQDEIEHVYCEIPEIIEEPQIELSSFIQNNLNSPETRRPLILSHQQQQQIHDALRNNVNENNEQSTLNFENNIFSDNISENFSQAKQENQASFSNCFDNKLYHCKEKDGLDKSLSKISTSQPGQHNGTNDSLGSSLNSNNNASSKRAHKTVNSSGFGFHASQHSFLSSSSKPQNKQELGDDEDDIDNDKQSALYFTRC